MAVVWAVSQDWINHEKEQIYCYLFEKTELVWMANIGTKNTEMEVYIDTLKLDIYFQKAKEQNCEVIIAHTHPGGPLEPSKTDRQGQKEINETIGWQTVDDVILTDQGIYSLTLNRAILKAELIKNEDK